jgi:hypothetical protein
MEHDPRGFKLFERLYAEPESAHNLEELAEFVVQV